MMNNDIFTQSVDVEALFFTLPLFIVGLSLTLLSVKIIRSAGSEKLLPFGECRIPNGDFVFSDYKIYCLNSMV